MVVSTPPMAEESVADQVKDLVKSRTSGLIRGLRVLVEAQQVVITGRTSSYYNKQLVSHAALEAGHNLTVCNEVQVGHESPNEN